MSVDCIGLESEIVNDLLDFNFFLLPFCDQRFLVEYVRKPRLKHGLLLKDLERNIYVAYNNFSGPKDIVVTNYDGVTEFCGFDCKTDDLDLGKKLSHYTIRSDACFCAYYVDKKYRDSGKNFRGVAISMHSISLLLMKELLERSKVEDDSDYLYVSKSSVTDFLIQAFGAQRHKNLEYHDCDDDFIGKHAGLDLEIEEFNLSY